jgi:hypothetical protein
MSASICALSAVALAVECRSLFAARSLHDHRPKRYVIRHSEQRLRISSTFVPMIAVGTVAFPSQKFSRAGKIPDGLALIQFYEFIEWNLMRPLMLSSSKRPASSAPR